MDFAAGHHDVIGMLVAAIGLAFLFGLVAQRFRAPPLVGYMLAGVVVGPHTPGYVANPELAREFAEIGVILLMFGVGLKISVADLWAVRRTAVPGAIGQMAIATLLGLGAARLLGFPFIEGLMIGLSLSVASTVVLLRALEAWRIEATPAGQLCIGWLVVEDLAIVLALVAIPALAGVGASGEALGLSLVFTLAKVAAFIGLMLVVGTRLFPWLIQRVAALYSPELLSLGALALALGLAWVAFAVFDASFALGAFLAGVALNGSHMSHRVAENSLPLRDTFAVLFFVSVGMLFDWRVLIEDPLAVLLLCLIVVVGKGLAAMLIARALRAPRLESLTAAAALAQIGEFSFVLAGLGLALGLLGQRAHDLILAAALVSILVNPLLFRLVDLQLRRNGQALAPA